ncbi:MAG: 4Fe-4S dicluster domain-containing protein, partial [Bacteroidota bacterium]|nr:4Fe-4S dicluster domain-containing protein [Bacteroidota bacterium]
INSMLGNYGSTIDLDGHTYFYQGDDAAVAQLVRDMRSGGVGALLIADCNPAYSLPNAIEFREGLGKVGLSVSFISHADETASLCNYICPGHHYLESWNDYQPKVGSYAIAQPAIRPLFNTRAWQENLLRWSNTPGSYYEFMQGTWQTSIAAVSGPFEDAWNTAVHNGVFQGSALPVVAGAAFAGNTAGASGTLRRNKKGEGFELQLYTTEAVGNGQHANNPWLQELPDPITKITWDNYVLVNPGDAERLGLNIYLGEQSPAHLVTLTVGDRSLTLPAVAAPGQKAGTLAIALGYGRGENGERVGKAAVVVSADGDIASVGRNAYPLTSLVNNTVSYDALNVSIEKAGGTWPMARTQTHFTHMDRHSIVKETSLPVFLAGNKNLYNAPHTLAVHEDVNQDGQMDSHDRKSVHEFDLWENHAVENVGHRWGMSIDLNSCTGCGACVTACTSENNVPVVGKDEVRRSREMHWLRIDRYFSSEMTHERGREEGKGKIERYLEMEVPSENPKVVFMPMLCQHCNHAPCETVCPVAATTHSNEGLNQMAYNRCIGTRYCANNCPYKVRRFNWFNYLSDKFAEVNPAWDDLGRMVLNPDVTVRARGVIEKCTMCVQRIQAGKLEAKKAGTPVIDGSIETACSAACGSGAIVFGDLNDRGSLVHKNANTDRSYYALEEIGTKPNINYMVKVRNTNEADHVNAHEQVQHS